MKIVMVSKALVVGEYQKKVEEIAKHPEVQIVAVVPPTWRDPAFERALERAHTQGYTLVVSPVRLNGHFHLFHFPGLGKILDEQEPDILHIDEEPYNLATFLAMREARRRGIPGLFFTWQNLARRYPWPFASMERYVYRTASWALAGTPAAARVLAAKGYRGPLSVIPQFGVDPETFQPAASPGFVQTGRIDDRVTIGFAGRLVREKGVSVLLDALSQLPSRFQLLILGDGPARGEAKAQCRMLGIDSRVAFQGPVPSSQMAHWLQNIDVLALPSVSRPNWAEQFGRVLIEAMACGVPVVGSTCGEIPEIVGDAGLIVPEGDATALAGALARVGESPDLRKSVATRGRARVLASFTHKRVAELTVATYRSVLAPSVR